jgi:hypothetical protein
MSASDFLKERNSAIVSNFKELSKDSSISGFRVLNINPIELSNSLLLGDSEPNTIFICS